MLKKFKKSKKKKPPKSSNNASNRQFLIIKKILIYFWVSVYGFSSFQRLISGMYRNKTVKKQYQHYFIKYIHVLIVKPNSLFFFYSNIHLSLFILCNFPKSYIDRSHAPQHIFTSRIFKFTRTKNYTPFKEYFLPF